MQFDYFETKFYMYSDNLGSKSQHKSGDKNFDRNNKNRGRFNGHRS